MPISFWIKAAIFVAMFRAIRAAAVRFAERARESGRWDSDGPLVETEGPPYRFRNKGMEERLEVIGDWIPPVINDRRQASDEHTEKQSGDHPSDDRH